MTTLKTVVTAALLVAGGTSLAIAQNGQMPPVTGAASNHAAPAPSAKKYQCVGIRQGLTECRTMQMSANNNQGTSNTAASPTTALHGTDTVILSAAQQKAIWNDLGKQASNQNAPGFNATTGTFVPNGVKIQPMPNQVTANNPSLQPYDFAILNHKLVIVDPSNKVIADVLTR